MPFRSVGLAVFIGDSALQHGENSWSVASDDIYDICTRLLPAMFDGRRGINTLLWPPDGFGRSFSYWKWPFEWRMFG